MYTPSWQQIKNNRWARRAAWAVGGVAALWAVGWLAVPPLLKNQAQKIASETLGRQVTIGAVDFKPWSLELTVTDLAVAMADGSAAQLAVKRLYADAELQSMLRLAPVVDAVTVEAPVLRLKHLGDGRYDIDDVLKKLVPPADAPPSEPAQFALYNLLLSDGEVDFTDAAVNRTHTLRELRLAVPFLSNLASQRDIHTDPRLAFKLNGSAFDSAAETTPFARTHKTDATLRLSGLDLAPYLGYIPASVPVRLQAAVLDADLRLAFEQNPQASLKLTGTVEARSVKMADTKQQDLLGFDSLKLSLDDVQPLARKISLSAVELTSPRLAVRRDRAGQLNLALASGAPDTSPESGKNSIAAVPPSGASGPQGTEKGTPERGASQAAPRPWQVSVARVALRGGAVDWTDDTTAAGKIPAAQIGLRELSVDASGIAVPFAQPLAFNGSAVVAPAPGAGGAPAPAGLQFSGTATDLSASVTATVSALPLAVAAPYVAQFLAPSLGGTLQAALGVAWQAADTRRPAALRVRLDRLALDKLALTQGRATLASIQGVEVTEALIEPFASTVSLGKLAVAQPKVKLERGADGRWMFEAWLRGARPSAGKTAAGAAPGVRRGAAAGQPAGASEAGSTWKLAIQDLQLTGGTLGWLDLAPGRPAAFDVTSLRVQMTNFALDAKKPMPLQLSARIGAGRTEPGRLNWRGNLGLHPVSALGSVDAVHIPVHAFEPYFGDGLNIELLRADTSFKGQVRYASTPAGPQARVTGDTTVEDFRANSVQGSPVSSGATPGSAAVSATAAGADPAAPRGTGLRIGEELLSWKALSLRGVDVSLAPGTATTVDVRETALSDFFARIIISESGRINLQDLVKSSATASTGGGTLTTTTTTTTTVAAAAASPATEAVAPVIRVGPISLLNGKVAFSDRFIQPNYSADLTDLTGQLSAFSSVSPDGNPQLADLELRGRAEGTASLEILGKLNPLAKPLALDIKGKVRDLELPPLSPYSVKYAGHGIERGKLSVDVAYKVQPDGQLTASNNLVLNQLTFGDKVEGAPASLPVKLAVALLADRNGVIDINLPISGSLNDPQFRLGPIIFKVIVNLIVKAITSPFSLLASAFGGGGDELSMVSFAPGSARLTTEAKQGLDKVAKALVDRPALKMTVVGTASLEAEREGYKRERLKALVQAEKRRAQVVNGSAVASPPNGTGSPAPAPVDVVSEAEYPALLKQVYRRADMPKPRNLVGMTKDIPQAEMEALLLAHIPATDDLMRELALQRGVAVKDYLVSRQLPLERLFLGAAKAVAPEAKWSPRAELSLATN